MFFGMSEPMIDAILDRLESRVRKILAEYGIEKKEPKTMQDFLDSLPHKTQAELEREGQLRITEVK